MWFSEKQNTAVLKVPTDIGPVLVFCRHVLFIQPRTEPGVRGSVIHLREGQIITTSSPIEEFVGVLGPFV